MYYETGIICSLFYVGDWDWVGWIFFWGEVDGILFWGFFICWGGIDFLDKKNVQYEEGIMMSFGSKNIPHEPGKHDNW